MKEEWRLTDVAGYKVSNLGRARRVLKAVDGRAVRIYATITSAVADNDITRCTMIRTLYGQRLLNPTNTTYRWA